MNTENEIDEIALATRSARREYDRLVGEAQSIAREGQAKQIQVKELKEEIDLLDKVTKVLNSIGEQRQDDAKRTIEALVTQGLQTIFGEDLSFHLETKAAGKVEFVVVTTLEDGSEIATTPIIDARGGGLAAIVGFLLRLVVLILKNKEDTVLFLDESFAHVSQEYEPRLAEFLREVVDKTGVQIIMVTHSTAYSDQADKIYHLSLDKKGMTVAREGATA